MEPPNNSTPEPEPIPDYSGLIPHAEALAQTLDGEMTSPQHEHSRGELVRNLGSAVENLSGLLAASVEAGTLEAIQRLTAESELKAAQWVHAKDVGRMLRREFRLERKLVRRANQVGQLRTTIRDLEAGRGRLIEELKARSRRIKELRQVVRIQDQHLIAAKESNASLRRRLRDAHLRKLQLTFRPGGMEVEVSGKVAEPVDPDVDAKLIEVIMSALDRNNCEFPQVQAAAVLQALRGVQEP